LKKEGYEWNEICRLCDEIVDSLLNF